MRLPIETVTVTIWVPKFSKWPLAGLALSIHEQVEEVVDQSAAGPQSVSVTVCGAGSPCPWVAMKVREPVLVLIHGGVDCGNTMSLTCTTAVLDPSVKVI